MALRNLELHARNDDEDARCHNYFSIQQILKTSSNQRLTDLSASIKAADVLNHY